MGLDNVPRCQHVKANGTQCGSPALRRRRDCFFHKRVRDQVTRIAAAGRGQPRFVVPLIEDANAIQLGLMQVMQLLGSGEMDHKTAGPMLYALQTASINLRKTNIEPAIVTNVVIDRSTVNRTRIGGQQWCQEDFENAESEQDEKSKTRKQSWSQANPNPSFSQSNSRMESMSVWRKPGVRCESWL